MLVVGENEKERTEEESGSTALTSDAAAANPIGSTAKCETGSPKWPTSSASLVELQPADYSDSSISMCSHHLLITVTMIVSLYSKLLTSMHAQLLIWVTLPVGLL